MKAVLSDIKSGAIEVHDIPAPEIQAGGILIRTAYSAISAGTEKVKVESGKKSLLGKAIARPDLVKQVIEYVQSNGLKAAYQKVQARLDTLSTMGYSCSGTVLAVGEGVTEFKPGDRVACGGGGYANHNEINFVPRNLAVSVPENVPLDAAALTTIGAIAMQGIRQANLAVGETVAVVGAGLVGVLTIQIARAAGCRVIAIDASAARAEAAIQFGAHLSLQPSDPGFAAAITGFSRYGADKALITAATPSAEPLEMAAKIVRERGNIVIVGDVGMGVSRGNMYMKELSLMMSRSYGPGRYDSSYEEGGQDYPVGYVRWTERRNMESFLDLISSGAIDVSRLVERRYDVEKCAQAYEDLKTGMYTAIFDYGAAPSQSKPVLLAHSGQQAPPSGTVRVGCVGAGGFARSMIFPNLHACAGVVFESVASNSGVAAESARKGFKFNRAQTSSDLIADPNVDAVFIITRHDSHARYVLQALERGKSVFVEKPLAVNERQLEQIKDLYTQLEISGKTPFVMVGFNRRFAPFTKQLVEFFDNRHEAMMVSARINAGFIPRDSWIQREGDGGRIVGEFCHFVDWARAVIGSPVRTVTAVSLPGGGRYTQDNISVTLTYVDGSVATLLYLANGDRAVPKEQFEVFCEGKIAQLSDFKELRLSRGGKTATTKSGLDKGHRRELELTIEAMKRGGPCPIPFAEIVETTAVTFAVERSIRSGQPIALKLS